MFSSFSSISTLSQLNITFQFDKQYSSLAAVTHVPYQSDSINQMLVQRQNGPNVDMYTESIVDL